MLGLEQKRNETLFALWEHAQSVKECNAVDSLARLEKALFKFMTS